MYRGLSFAIPQTLNVSFYNVHAIGWPPREKTVAMICYESRPILERSHTCVPVLFNLGTWLVYLGQDAAYNSHILDHAGARSQVESYISSADPIETESV
jgi:hypothetical protein